MDLMGHSEDTVEGGFLCTFMFVFGGMTLVDLPSFLKFEVPATVAGVVEGSELRSWRAD